MSNLLSLLSNLTKYQLNLKFRIPIIAKYSESKTLIKKIPLDVLSEILAPLILKEDYEKLLKAYENEEEMEYLKTPYIISKTRHLIKYPDFNKIKMASYVLLGSIEFQNTRNRDNTYKFTITANVKKISIGKDPSNNIVLNEEGIADFHAYIKPKVIYDDRHGQYFLVEFRIYNNFVENETYLRVDRQPWQNINENNIMEMGGSGIYQLKIASTIFELDMTNSYAIPFITELANPIKLTQITKEGKLLSYPIELLYKVGKGDFPIYNLHIGRYEDGTSKQMSKKMPYIGVITDSRTISRDHLTIFPFFDGSAVLHAEKLVYINGIVQRRAHHSALNDGDIIRLGDSDVYFKFEYIKSK